MDLVDKSLLQSKDNRDWSLVEINSMFGLVASSSSKLEDDENRVIVV